MTYAIQNKNFDKNRVFILQKSELEKRLDPSTYHPERRNVINALKKSGHKLEPLKFISTFDKNIVKEIPENLPYLGLENIESNTGTYIQTNEKESISSAILFDKGKVLFPKLRPYLNKVYFAEFDGVCSTEFHILDSKKVSNEYLANFLRTNLVVNQTKYLMSGNTLPRLQTEDIESLLIPILPTEKEDLINKMMRNAFTYKKQSEAAVEKLLAGIDDYLLGELGITLPAENSVNDFAIKQNGFELNNQNSVVQKGRLFLTRFKEIGGGRFDPKLYTNATKNLLNSLKSSKYTMSKLKSIITQSIAGDWGNDDTENFDTENFVRCLVIRATEFENKGNLNVNGDRAKYRLIDKQKYAALNIKTNDLLIEKSGGSENQPVGRIAILSKDLTDQYTLGYSNFVHKIRIDTNKAYPEYVFDYLKTLHNIKITDVMQSQTNGIRNLILNEYFALLISLPSLEKQKEIANHIQTIRDKANDLKTNATQILQQAKEKIEKLILG
jgi:type I restriction enzyme S subunit